MGKFGFINILLLSVYYTVHGSITDACNATNGVGAWMGDGACDPQNLSSECGWDGGDCCRCTCDDDKYICGREGFLCIDPEAVDNGTTTCEQIIPSPCPTDGKRKWIVENTTQVRALAEAVNCSDGRFEVEWRGSIMLDTEITVVGGTFLNITGALNFSAVLDGGNKTRLFRVVGASLQLNHVQIINGNATFGGAIVAIGSTLSFHQTDFVGNTAYDKNGGAIFVYGGSNIYFSGTTNFFKNTCKSHGGALYVVNSSVSWGGESSFSDNSATYSGGALCAVVGSTVSWMGNATFNGNHANIDNGGALYLESRSNASWSTTATFVDNDASYEGGAIFVNLDSDAAWSGITYFSGNTASKGGGGAILIGDSSRVTWSGDTIFNNNRCGAQGGAVSSRALSSSTSINPGIDKSSLLIKGTIAFTNNTCGSNGGGVAILGGLSVLFEMNDTTFIDNKAKVAGGAVSISATGEGPIFTNATFRSNSAKVGGGIFITGTGTYLDEGLSATFDGCMFIENRADATGGAIESATGAVVVRETNFTSNKATMGGALRLTGATSLTGCTFVDNISDLDGGQAISMIGYILEMENCLFSDNTYDCNSGTFLNESGPGNRFEAACSGCDDCDTCVVENSGTVSTCSAVMEHSTSIGGSVTLMTISIEEGYWRATNSSTNIVACYNELACSGGVTGSLIFCAEGYTGPYCAVCTNHYVERPMFSCTKCSDNVGGLVAAVILATFVVIVIFVAVEYVVSEDLATGQGITTRLLRRVPLESVKVIIAAWQILTQFATVANVHYPGIYQTFLNAADVLNFDPTWMVLEGCFINVNFHGRLLIVTIWPIFALILLSGTYTCSVCRPGATEETLTTIRRKHVSVAILILFLVYSSASSVIFQMFDCEVLDDGQTYLRADYTITCDGPRHRTLMIYAGFMVFLYPLGIPAFFAYLLLQSRHNLVDQAGDHDSPSMMLISGLWKQYKRSRFYYEIIECGRRITLAGVLLNVLGNSVTQITITLMLAFVFTVISEGLAPYVSRTDAWVNRLGHAAVFTSIYYALLLKVNGYYETHSRGNLFGVILIAIHVAMILAVLFEAIVARNFNDQVEDPRPRFRSARSWTTTRSKNGICRVTHNSIFLDDI